MQPQSISGFNILEKLGESICARIYKVKPDKPDASPKVLKLIKSRFCFKGLHESLNQQIQQITHHNLHHIIIPSLQHTKKNEIFLIQDFFSKYNLEQWRQSITKFHLPTFLDIAISLTELIAKNHLAAHIHKSIKPANILINPKTLELRLIDDVHILDINQLSHFIFNDYFCKHALPYISPEQTGRIQPTIDYTTDLYSLGIVLYELFAGKTPFINNDPLEIIHSHLAEIPKPLSKINQIIPVQLDKIILKLLQKLPEKRYQTAKGLQYDLKRILTALQMSDSIIPFDLGTQDFSNRITIPSIMVGRSRQKEQLLKEYQLVCEGKFRAAIISGFSGIGKTRLVQELELPIIAKRGYYAFGKFDQYQKYIPNSTLIQALRHLMQSILTEESNRIAYWKNRILDAAGKNGQLIIDLIPEVELITGKQPKIASLPPVEASNRFNIIARRFIACLADKKHPLTIFIDDLQWCDSATFDLFEIIFNNQNKYPYLFWIGAYRHNEVDESHRLVQLLKKIEKQPILQIHLEALNSKNVNEMTAYILNTYPERTFDLSGVIHKVSEGNPLFVNESLRWMHDRHHLDLTEKGVWSWDNDQISHCNIPKSAQDLFKEKISGLPEKCIELLKIAACLGANFKAEDLAQTAEIQINVLYDILKKAFALNILRQEKTRLVFFHDQVQAAADSLLSAEKKRKTHAKIAKSMIKAIPAGTDPKSLDNLFAIVKHLAMGRPDIKNDAQNFEQNIIESRFNYYAGLSAMKTQAIENAYHFFKESTYLYPHKIWKDDYVFLFSLHKKYARAALSTGRQKESEKIIDILLAKAKTNLDRAECLAGQTSSLSSIGNIKDAIRMGNKALAYFNKEILHDDKLAMKKTKRLFKKIHGRDNDIWQKILEMEPATNRALQIETSVYSDLIPDYYLTGMVPQLYLTAMQCIETCLKGGVDESIIYPTMIISLYLRQQGQFEMAFKYEELSLKMVAKHPDTFGATRGINAAIWLHLHNRENIRFIIEQSWKNIHRGKNCGDLQHTGFTYAACLWPMIVQGENFNKVIDTANECVKFSKKYNLSLSIGLGKSVLYGWSDEMSINRKPLEENKIKRLIKTWEMDKHIASIGCYYILKGMALYFLGQYKKAGDLLKNAKPCLTGLTGTLLNRLWHVFTYLSALKCNDGSAKALKDKEFLQLTDHCMKRVKVWTNLGPFLKPYLFLMEMEYARIFKDFSETRRYCLDGIDSAHDQGYIFLEGYLNECLGEMLIKSYNDNAIYHLNKASGLYNSCKAEIMEKRIIAAFNLDQIKAATDTQNDLLLPETLDLDYLDKATKAITSELDFNRLIKIIIKAVMARLGAVTGFLLIAEKKTLAPYACGVKKKSVLVKIKDAPGFSTNKLSMKIARYVYNTKKMLILEDACTKGNFTLDKVVQKEQLSSVLCLPLLKQRKIVGILYLENSLIKSVFSDNQVELAGLLTAQAAIAIENAVLLQDMKHAHATINQMNINLEQRVKERTIEVDKANEELKDFAYIISHDLKAPLRGINQLAGWLAEDFHDQIAKEGQQMLDLLQNRASRMHDMIEGILQYSRIGRINEFRKKVDLNKLVNEVAELIAMPKSISFKIIQRLPVIMCEETLLFQVFQNLFDNAVKYMDKQKREISVDYIEKDESWQFCVADNGPGIDKKYQKKIFKIFQTLEPKDETNSTGIGLALVQKIIHNWGGRIWLESEIGFGSKFFFIIPKKRIKNH